MFCRRDGGLSWGAILGWSILAASFAAIAAMDLIPR